MKKKVTSMKRNSIIFIVILSLFTHNATACSKFVNDMIGLAVITVASLGAVSVGAASYGGYKGYQSLKYHFSSTPEKVKTDLEHMKVQANRMVLALNAGSLLTPEERTDLLRMLEEHQHKVEQAKITLEHNIKMAKE